MPLFEDRKTCTPEQAAERLGFDVEQIWALGNSLGLAQNDRVDEADLEMLTMSKSMLDAGMTWETLLDGARVYADSLRRIAEASLHLTHQNFCEPLARAGQDEPEIATVVGDAVGVFAPTSEALMVALYRKFIREAALQHAAAHLEPRELDAPPGSMRSTIVFIDVALFSTYADLHGDLAAVELVDRFDRSVRESATRYRGRIVKQIGDEFMLVFSEPSDAVQFATEINEVMARADRDVAPRTGIHHGLVIYRLGDYFGTAVNVAARIASMALPNSILVTEPVAKAAADQGFQVAELGVRSLRGMEEPVPLYRVLPVDSA
jgi:class 3 adenylate cyclase